LLELGGVSARVDPGNSQTADFSVSSPMATATARGTAFSMRHIEDPEARTTIFVTAGSVDVVPQNALLAPVTLEAGQAVAVTSEEVSFLEDPAIAMVTPSAGDSGDVILIAGENFSPSADNVVRFADVRAEVLSASTTEIEARVPEGLPAGPAPVTVTVGGVSSAPAAFTIETDRTPTEVSGNQSGMWTLAQSPYLVTSDVTVPQGETLTIEPGVVVQFRSSSHDLFVNGALIAEGTADAPIRFTSDDAVKAPGQWGRIRFNEASDDARCVLAHCIVEFGGGSASGNIEANNASPRIEKTTIRGGSQHGLFLTGSDATVSGCVFENNAGNAIQMNVASFPELEQNLAVNNGL
jgi:hypothetical protein